MAKVFVELTCGACGGSGKHPKGIDSFAHKLVDTKGQVPDCDTCLGKGAVQQWVTVDEFKKLLEPPVQAAA